MFAFRAANVGDYGRHVLLHEGRNGAGDEGTGSDVAGNGEEDHVVRTVMAIFQEVSPSDLSLTSVGPGRNIWDAGIG